MPSFQYRNFVSALALLASLACVSALAQTSAQPGAGTAQPSQQKSQKSHTQTPPQIGFGSTPTPEDMGTMAWASGASGKDLPPGSGTAKQGAQIFKVKCEFCHGRDAEGVHWKPGEFSPYHGVRLGGGNAVPVFNRAPGQITTMAWLVPWATPIFNVIAVEMPLFKAGSLKPDEVYALTAFILFKNGIIKEDDVMDRETLPNVQMPNRKAFPATDQAYLDMKKRGCYKTYGVCLGD